MYLNSLTLDINKLRVLRPAVCQQGDGSRLQENFPAYSGRGSATLEKQGEHPAYCVFAGRETAYKQSYRLPKPILQMDVLSPVF